MSRFQKPYTCRWLSLGIIGLMVCLVYVAVVAAQPKGAPKELKLGFGGLLLWCGGHVWCLGEEHRRVAGG